MKAKNTNSADQQTYPIEAPEEDYLYNQDSQIEDAGNGLYTAIDIYENDVISIFKGEIISDQEAVKREKRNEDQYFINLLDGSIMDSKQTHCFAKYANDAEGITGGPFKNNAKITLDDDDNVCIVATTDTSIGEEIFCGYGKSYWEKHG